ncbi:hypothetical protein B1A_16153, partial [mine drainage metagenome]
RPQRLLIQVTPQGQGSQVSVSFHILPGDIASDSVTRSEMCGMIAAAFRGSARWLPAQSVAGNAPQSAAPTADVAHGPDVTKFAIAGVRLGMSYPQALKAVEKFLHVKRSAIHFDWYGRIAHTVPDYIDVRLPHEQYTVQFAHRVPVSKSDPAVVEALDYDMIPWTSENVRALRLAAIKKYGPPTADGVGEQWCSKAFSGVCASG